MTDDMRDKLVNDVMARKFKLKLIENELQFLNRKGFPLPEFLTEEQWKMLLSFRELEFRTRYLDALVSKDGNLEEKIESLKAKDEKMANGIVFTEEMFAGITCPEDIDLKVQIEMIQQVYDEMKEQGEAVPYHLTEGNLKELLSTQGIGKVYGILRFLNITRQSKLNDLVKKRARAAGRKLKEQQADENSHIIYGLGHNTLFYRILEKTTIERFYNWNVIREEIDGTGQPVVIDLQYMNEMSYKQCKSLAYRELAHGLKRNKMSLTPFIPYFTSYKPDCEKCKLLHQALPNLFDPASPTHVTEKHVSEMFPKERLVYLTPNSKNDLLTHDSDDIYIIGGLVDGSTGTPLTLAEAKKMGVRHARLPMRKFLGWPHELNVDHMLAVLADFRATKDWFYAFRWVPPRFFRNHAVREASKVEEARYRTHADLSPTSYQNLVTMSPQDYRKRYGELMNKYLAKEKQAGNFNDRYERPIGSGRRPFEPQQLHHRFKNKQEEQ